MDNEKDKKTCIKIDSKKNILLLDILGIIVFLMAYFISDLKINLRIGMYIVSYLLIGFEIFLKAIRHLFKKDMFDENLLMTLATVGALVIGEYIEGVAVLLLYKIGEFLQDLAIDNSKQKIKSVIDIRAEYANIIVNGDIKKIDPKNLKIGDTIVVKSGEKVPVDGIITKGQTQMDTSSLTGESVPRVLNKNEEVLSGSINVGNIVEIRVTKTFENSTASKVLELIENAQNNKSNTENFITKFSKTYTPIVIAIAILIAMSFPSFFNISLWEALNRALIFLVLACPCAIVISVPLGFFVGIGTCSKNGILVKGSNYLDMLSSIDVLAFDKTGTLTKGIFAISKIDNKSELNDDEFMEYIALCESYSNHYIAKSVMNSYNKKLDKTKVTNHKEISGHGIEAYIDNKKVLVGNKLLLEQNNIKISSSDAILNTVVYLAVDGVYMGYIELSDKLKDGVEMLTSNLKKRGIKKNILLTGDSKSIAENVGKKLNFDEIYSELLPGDKVKILQDLKNKENVKVGFVGDGINDSPVIASADIGISMGNGSDIAIDTSDIVLMTDEPERLVKALSISKITKRIVLENIIFAISIKVIVLLLGGLGVAKIWEAIFADVGVSLIAIFNSIRIFKMK